MSKNKFRTISLTKIKRTTYKTATILSLLILSFSFFTEVQTASNNPINEDFENAEKISIDTMSGIVFDHTFWYEYDGGARFWVEGLDESNIQPHSGSRCVGMELYDIDTSRRNEFNLMNMYSRVGNEFSTSAWYYLPPDWDLDAGSGQNWYSIFAITTGGPNWAPYLEVAFEDMTSQGGSGAYRTFIISRDANQYKTHLAVYDNFPLPLGRWFKIETQFSQPDRIFKVWIDGIQTADLTLSSIQTPIFDDNALITICKIYHDVRDTLPNRIWIDDVTIEPLEANPPPEDSYSITVNTPGLASASDIIHYVEDGVSKSGSVTSGSWTGTCDSGSALSVDDTIFINDDAYYNTTDTTSWIISGNQTYTILYHYSSQSESTKEVLVKLIDSTGKGIIGGTVEYFESGWKEFGSTDSNGEVKKDLVLGTYRFRISYRGESQIQRQDIRRNQIVTFQTIKVIVQLLDKNKKGLAGGWARYYANSWKTIGITDDDGSVTIELLPLTYTFQMSYEGETLKKRQNIESNPSVTFKIR